MSFTPLEAALLAWIRERAEPELARLLGEVRFGSREHTGHGRFVQLEAPARGPAPAGEVFDSTPVPGPNFVSPELPHGGGSVLFLSDGLPETLELFAYGGEFPAEIAAFTLEASSVAAACAFETERLLVGEWHGLEAEHQDDWSLPAVVAGLLTEPVTRSLPPGWQGGYDAERAARWIVERDLEGTVLLVLEGERRTPVGLVLLHQTADETGDRIELRLGYLLAEAAWGRGLATELLLGFVAWCRRSGVASVVGGVARENAGSRRVMEKVGFVPEPEDAGGETEELLYRWTPMSDQRSREEPDS